MTEDYKYIEENLQKFVDETLEVANKNLAKIRKEELLRNYKGSDKIVSFEDTYQKQLLVKKEYISTGYGELDKRLGGGICKKELILITGLTGNGKTNYCFNLTKNMQKENCLWFPYEESAEELADKIIIWKKQPIKFHHPEVMLEENLDWIEERILESKIKYGTNVVFIDNLHFLTMSEEENTFSKTSMFAKRLKVLAKKIDVAIVLIAHLKKVKNGITYMPTYQDVSGSSDIVKVADKILCVWRECKEAKNGEIEYTNTTKVAIQKVRGAGGSLGTTCFNWNDGEYQEFSLSGFVNELKIKY